MAKTKPSVKDRLYKDYNKSRLAIDGAISKKLPEETIKDLIMETAKKQQAYEKSLAPTGRIMLFSTGGGAAAGGLGGALTGAYSGVIAGAITGAVAGTVLPVVGNVLGAIVGALGVIAFSAIVGAVGGALVGLLGGGFASSSISSQRARDAQKAGNLAVDQYQKGTTIANIFKDLEVAKVAAPVNVKPVTPEVAQQQKTSEEVFKKYVEGEGKSISASSNGKESNQEEGWRKTVSETKVPDNQTKSNSVF